MRRLDRPGQRRCASCCPTLGAANFDPEFYAQHEAEVLAAYNRRFPEQPLAAPRKSAASSFLSLPARPRRRWRRGGPMTSEHRATALLLSSVRARGFPAGFRLLLAAPLFLALRAVARLRLEKPARERNFERRSARRIESGGSFELRNPFAWNTRADTFIAAANEKGRQHLGVGPAGPQDGAGERCQPRLSARAHTGLYLLLSIGLACLGGLLHFLPRIWLSPPGIRNDGTFQSSSKSRGMLGILIGVLLTGFYVLLYFYPFLITGWIRLADPVSRLLRGKDADQWFFYGFLYTLCVLVMGVRMAIAYRHSRYQLVRSASVAFFQLGFAFLIPAILVSLNKPSYDFKSAWPLDYGFFTDYNLKYLMSQGNLGWAILIWGIALSFLLVPLFSYFFGKRWYCSWVCGCGGWPKPWATPGATSRAKSSAPGGSSAGWCTWCWWRWWR